MSAPQDRAGAIEAAWRRERPDLDPSSIGVVTRVWHLAKLFGEQRRRLLAEHDVDPALLDLLGTLRRSGPPCTLSTRELAHRALVTPAAISQRLSRAEAAGWVTRVRGDARSVEVHLTEAGRAVIDAAAGAIFAREDVLLAGLTPDEREHLARLLQALIADLEAHEPSRSGGESGQ